MSLLCPAVEEPRVILQENPSSIEELKVLKETPPSIEEQKDLKETPSSDGEQEIFKETLSSIEEQDDQIKIPSLDGEENLKEIITPAEEQFQKDTLLSDEKGDLKVITTPADEQFQKETLLSDEKGDLKVITTPAEEQFQKETLLSDEKGDLKVITTPAEEQFQNETLLSDADLEDLKKNPPYEGELEVLLQESEIKKEPDEIQEIDYGVLDEPIYISSDDEELDMPQLVPMPPCYTISNLDTSESYDDEPKRSISTPPFNDVNLSVLKRRCLSVPKDIRLLKEPIDYIVISDTDSIEELEIESKPCLKRKRSLNIPSYIEVENSRKTMKPGPKSKTRNIATVHDLLTKANELGVGPSMDSFTSSDETISDEESNFSDEYESDSDVILLDSSSDDEMIYIEPKVIELSAEGEATCSFDNHVKENSINGENKIINNELGEALDDKMNETEVLENIVDLSEIKEDDKMNETGVLENIVDLSEIKEDDKMNETGVLENIVDLSEIKEDDKMNETGVLENIIDLSEIKEDENMENKELTNIEIHPTQIIEDENMENKELTNIEIHPTQIIEDENMEKKELTNIEIHPTQIIEDTSYNNEIEKNNSLNDANELLKVGE